MERLTLAILVAAGLWFLMFSPWTASWFNFWWAMTASAVILTTMAFFFGGKGQGARGETFPRLASQLLLGILIAIVLWGVFWVGDRLSSLLFDFARPQVDDIYQMKDGNAPWLIGLLLLCIIGPAEELFWRGYVQRTLSSHWNANAAFVATTLVYTLIHIPSLNFMLVMAALTCGICWGGLYRLFPRHLPAIVISHALWDAAAFVWFPL